MKVWVYRGDRVPKASFRLLLKCWEQLDPELRISELGVLFPNQGVQMKGPLFVVGGGSIIIDQEIDGENRSATHDRFYPTALRLV